MSEIVKKRIGESILVKQAVLEDNEIIDLIDSIASVMVRALNNGNKIFFAGNGGSMADALHLTAEFINRFMAERRPLPAIALGANNSNITAIGNDYAYDQVFAKELLALGNAGDVLIAISTSGNSKNVLNAIDVARQKNMPVFGFTGRDGGVMKDMCPCIRVPSDVTARIQEVHILAGHIICELVERKIIAK